MDIAVIGASIPGLIMAMELRFGGHNVDVYGDPSRARSNDALGPQYLWATKASLDFLTYKLGWDQKIIADSVRQFHVRWMSKGFDIGSNGQIDKERIAGYAAKFGGNPTSHPCRGFSEFYAIPNGLPRVNKALTAALEPAGVRLIREDVIYIAPRKDCVVVDTALSGSQTYDGVVNTLSRDIWMRLIGKPCPPLTQTTYFLVSNVEPVVGAQTNALYYDGDPGTPFYRASYSFSMGAWVYESMQSKIDREVIKAVPVVSKFTSAQAPGISELPRITHVGRWAEMRPEMMVDDVMENSRHYAFVVERSA